MTAERDAARVEAARRAQAVKVASGRAEEVAEQLEALTVERDRVLTELGEVHEEREVALAREQEVRSALAEGQARADAVAEQLERVTADRDVARARGRAADEQRQVAVAREEEVRAALEDAHARLAAADDELERARQQATELAQAHEREAALRERVRDAVSSWSQRHADAERTGTDMMARADAERWRVEALGAELTDLAGERDVARAQIRALEARVAEDQERRGALVVERDALARRVAGLERELTGTRERARGLERGTKEWARLQATMDEALRAATVRAVDAANRLDVGERRLQATERSLQDSEQRLREYEQRFEATRAQVTEVAAERDALDKKATLSEQRAALGDEQRVELSAEIARLEVGLTKALDHAHGLEQALARTQQELERAGERSEGWTEKVFVLGEERERLLNEGQTLKGALDGHGRKIQDLKGTRERLEADLVEARTDVAALGEQLERTREHHEQLAAAHAELKVAHAQLSEAHTELGEAHEQLEEAHERLEMSRSVRFVRGLWRTRQRSSHARGLEHRETPDAKRLPPGSD